MNTIETIVRPLTMEQRVLAAHTWWQQDVEYIVLEFSTVRTDGGAVRHLVPHECIVLDYIVY